MKVDIAVKPMRNMSSGEAQRLIERSWAFAFDQQTSSLTADMDACGLKIENFDAKSCPYVIKEAPGDNRAIPGPIELVVGLAITTILRKRAATSRLEEGLRQLWTKRFASVLEQ